MTRILPLAALLFIIALLALGCAQEKTAEGPALAPGPDYGRPLPPGRSALRLILDPRHYPDLGRAYRDRDALLLSAMEESLRWFAAPSSRQFFPFEGITHDQARESVAAMLDLLEHSPSESAFIADVKRLFDIYESVGYNGEGIVLFTGYYAPIFNASRTRTERFTHPLYARPEDLVTDPVTGEPQGRRAADGSVVPYYTRREIEASNMFAGSELVWLEDALSAYIIHINGSAKLRLTDGSVMYIGYAGKTDRPYASLGQAMVEAGLLRRGAVTLSAIRRTFRRHPRQVRELMLTNENYVFFTEYEGGNWPAGSLGVKVTAERSLATDKKIYPRGGVVLVDTEAVTFDAGSRRFLRFMLDQDTGGAIQAPGRADMFMGVGPGAAILAGGQYAEGRLYYLFLKPEHVPAGARGARGG
ncbi:MAG: MltA domain-containing protein [Planctomycetota bacterium]|nr:MltA domain-containing protein [Planctomycetota bacterium]